MLGLAASIITIAVIGAGQPDGARPTDKPGTPDARIGAVAESEGLAEEGWQLWSDGKYDQASRVFAKAITLDPQSANLWNGLGWSLFHTGERDKAADAFEQALLLQEAHLAALNGMGQIAFANRDYKTAKDWFLKAENAPAAQYSLVSAYLLLGEYEPAATLSEELLKALPEDSQDESIQSQRAWMSQLHAAAALGELPSDLRSKIEPPEPKHGNVAAAEGLSQKGWALWGERKWRAAELAFLEALELDPDLANAHNGLGWALITQGQPARAQKHLERCIELEPDHGGAINGLALSLKNQGKIDQAIEIWEELYRQSPQPHAGAVNLARTYVEQGRYEDAVPILEQLIEANPGVTEYQQLLDQARGTGGVDEKAASNPLDNGGFERGTKGWIIGSNSGRIKLAPDRQEKTEGKQSLRITKTGGVPIDIVRIDAEGLIPGQTVEVSASIKAEKVGNAWMKFFVWDAAGDDLVSDVDVARIHGTHGWRTIKKRFTVPEGTQRAAVQFWMILDGTLWIDDVRIEPVD